MKKNKLVALSLLAVSATAALASCAGKQPQQKVDVYFHAKSQVIVNTDTGETEPVEYIDSECATVEVKNKENLKYGEQDVEITVRPTQFFTCRPYDSDWYPVGAPIKPYVGLGSPTSLYNYPLEENVAWTFEDKSTAEDGEAYLITVKKEFFQKNIVIDYGNVNPKRAMYAYTSNFYNKLFTDNLEFEGDFNNKNTYEMDNKLSAFTAAGKGAIITYKFKNEVNPYTFAGWDAFKSESTNNAENLEYQHFSIKGFKEVSDTEGVELATYNPELAMDFQDFQVKIAENGAYISFFINWKLLAKDDKDYTPLYKKIKMSFSEPTLAYDSLSEGEDVKFYLNDFFQHTGSTERKPFTDYGKIIAFDNDTPKQLPFENVFVNGQYLPNGEHIQFASIFQLNRGGDQNKYFHLTINNNRILKVDLVSGYAEFTTWHKDLADPDEKDLQYWQIKDNVGNVIWNLVQLNPDGRKTGVPPELTGQSNLYCLYSTSAKALEEAVPSGDKSTVSIRVDYDPVPQYTSFTLAESAQPFGKLNNNSEASDPYSYNYPCGGKSEVDIRFYPENAYKSSAFKATLTKYQESDYTATYTPGDNYATIHIELVSGAFATGDKVEISVEQAPTYAYLVGETSALGGFIKSLEDTEEPTPICNNVCHDQTIAWCYFKFVSPYTYLATGEYENKYLKIFSYNGGKQLEPDIRPTEKEGVVELFFNTTEQIGDLGFSFAVEFKYMEVTPQIGPKLAQELEKAKAGIFFDTEQTYNNYVGLPTNNEVVINFTAKNSEVVEKLLSTVQPKADCQLTPVDKNSVRVNFDKASNKGEIRVGFDKMQSNYIHNGSILGVTLEL